jgi:hypothetical protein
MAVVLSLSSLPLCADTTTTAATFNFGAFSTSNWRSGDFSGSAYRKWDAAADSFCFTWSTVSGDQIGRIGVTYGSSYLAGWQGVQIDDIQPDCIMSTNATYTPTSAAWFYWSIYGWTHSSYTYWGNTPNGWNNEFYIVFYTDMTKAAIETNGCVSIDSVVVDGVTFDCYNTPRAAQSQWFAVCRSKTWNASVNLKKIFDYWRSKGLANEYVVDLGWALEGFVGSGGTLQLTNVNIADLTAPSSTAMKSAPLHVCNQASRRLHVFTLDGRTVLQPEAAIRYRSVSTPLIRVGEDGNPR